MYSFLRQLNKPCEKHVQLFYALGICSSDDLEGLCKMSLDCLELLQNGLLAKGMTLYEWMNVKAGLNELRLLKGS